MKKLFLFATGLVALSMQRGLPDKFAYGRKLQAGTYPCACLKNCPCAGETTVRQDNPCQCAGMCTCNFPGSVDTGSDNGSATGTGTGSGSASTKGNGQASGSGSGTGTGTGIGAGGEVPPPVVPSGDKAPMMNNSCLSGCQAVYPPVFSASNMDKLQAKCPGYNPTPCGCGEDFLYLCPCNC